VFHLTLFPYFTYFLQVWLLPG